MKNNSAVNEYLIGIIEECSEVQKACSKAIRYGLENEHRECTYGTNADDIMVEYLHIQSLINKLQRMKVLPIYNDEHKEYLKRDKVKRFKRCLGFLKEK